MKTIQTVNGPISPAQLGKTLMHEHCIVKQPEAYRTLESDDPEYVAFINSKVTMENRSQIYYYMHKHNDNLDISDVDGSIKEFSYLKAAGGDTVVDVTTPGIGRDMTTLRRIADATGLQIVASAGLYIEDSWPEQFRTMEKRELADCILQDLQVGADGTDIRAGYIGEIGMSDDWTDKEVLGLRAAAIACRESGIAMTVHMPIFQTWGGRILDILEEEGADLNRVVLSHCDPTLTVPGYHESLLERGCRLQFDQFALEFPCTYGPYVKRWLPRDIDRIRHIKYLCELGYEDKITLSQDLCFKSLYQTYGGPGVAHILKNLVPYFLCEGITQAQLNKLLVENPAAVLTPVE